MDGYNSRFALMTEEKVLQLLAFRECVVLSPSLYYYVDTVIFFNFGK